MINIDSSVFIQIINFLFLIWALNTVLYKPIRNILRKRKEKIDGLQQNIEAFEKDARDKDAAFYSGIKEARTTGLKEKEALLAKAADTEKEIIGRINQKAREELTTLREKITQDAQAVRSSLEKEVGQYAEAIAQKVLGRAVR